ncbi:MAG: MFS transporter [Pirellulaceae bacterium]|nr:MFS transporter [Pirellulaceae bacterium]
MNQPPLPGTDFSATARYVILGAAFLGWMASGLQMAVMTLSARSATTEFLRTGNLSSGQIFRPQRLLVPLALPRTIPAPATDEDRQRKAVGGLWFSWYNAGFLLGAATGGLVFGWLGDRLGRVRAMGASIFCFSVFSAVGYCATTPEQILLLRFLAGMGVGGMWPTGVALASEAWSDSARPMISGMLGTSANVGLLFMNTLGYVDPPTPDSWRWLLLVCTTPMVLAFLVWTLVPESRRWLAVRAAPPSPNSAAIAPSVFAPPILWRTLIGIAIGTIPVLGGWAGTQWLIPWTDKVLGPTQPEQMALTAIMRSGGAIFGGLVGGWIASLAGRRTAFFFVCLASLLVGQFIYLVLDPTSPAFKPAVFVLGVITTIHFGWMPLYLPELFPTAVRSTGAGVSFNFGRILAAVGVLVTGFNTKILGDDYGRAGSIAMLIYAVGMVVILFAPDTTKDKLED